MAEKVKGWLNVVNECQIETSMKKIMDSLKTVKLEEDEVILSFDVTSLYTKVTVSRSDRCMCRPPL